MIKPEEMNDYDLLEHVINEVGESLLDDRLELMNFISDVLFERYEPLGRQELLDSLAALKKK